MRAYHRRAMGLMACALALPLWAGCMSQHEQRQKESPTVIRQETYQGQPAYRMSNGIVELVAVPGTGRISHFSLAGQGNALWTNPAPKPATAPAGSYNDGGDKVWVWPQADWPKHLGRSWPGPDATDLPHEAAVDGQTLRLTSRTFQGYGVRCVREISLHGQTAHIVSRFEKVEEGGEFPLAVWTVTEIPFADAVAARILPAPSLPEGFKQDPVWGPVADWRFVPTQAGNVRLIERPSTSGKVFVEADALGAAQGNVVFIQRARPSPSDSYAPGDRAQVYTEPATKGAGFMELEFTSPLRALTKGQAVTLDLTWELHQLQSAEQARGELVRLVAGQ